MAALFIDDETNSDWIKYGQRARDAAKKLKESSEKQAICLRCKHWNGNFSCSAFESIPAEIWTGANDHTQPYKGDGGIRFEAEDASNGKD